jgi:hypothetical protein
VVSGSPGADGVAGLLRSPGAVLSFGVAGADGAVEAPEVGDVVSLPAAPTGAEVWVGLDGMAAVAVGAVASDAAGWSAAEAELLDGPPSTPTAIRPKTRTMMDARPATASTA